MKPEYIKVMQRKIHSANVLMGRQRKLPGCNFNTFMAFVCPNGHLSEKVDETIESRYELACLITGISKVERNPGKYDFMYLNYLLDWIMDASNEGYLPYTPEEWKIIAEVQ